MLAKRFVAMAMVLSLMLATAAPVMAQEQYAQGTQYAQGAQYAPEEAPGGAEELAVTGILYSYEDVSGETVYGIVDETTGESYPLAAGAGVEFGAYVDERVTLYGFNVEADNQAGRVLNVTRVEAAGEDSGGEVEDFAASGVVESVGERADGTLGYGLVVAEGEPGGATTWRASSTSARSRGGTSPSSARS